MNDLSKTIGLYGGTFDPVHFGHLHLAQSLYQAHGLKEVWFLPARLNPLKDREPTPFFHRAEMVRLAIQEIPQYRLEEIEQSLPVPSYTIDTLHALQRKYPGQPFALLLGEDSAYSLPNWKKAQELVEQIPILIGARCLIPLDFSSFSPRIRQAITTGWTPIPLVDISAVDLRKQLHLGQDCSPYIPRKVIDYISKNCLY